MSPSQAVLDAMVKSWGFPERHVELVGKCNTSGEWGRKYEKVYQWISNRRGFMLALIGNRGTGKTQMAACLACSLCDAQGTKRAQYARAMDVFLDLKDSFRKGSEMSERGVIAKYSAPETLVLDEMHVRGESKWENDIRTSILDARYAKPDRKTILISNDSGTKFRESMGPSVMDRLVETGVIVEFDWESMRGKQ